MRYPKVISLLAVQRKAMNSDKGHILRFSRQIVPSCSIPRTILRISPEGMPVSRDTCLMVLGHSRKDRLMISSLVMLLFLLSVNTVEEVPYGYLHLIKLLPAQVHLLHAGEAVGIGGPQLAEHRVEPFLEVPEPVRLVEEPGTQLTCSPEVLPSVHLLLADILLHLLVEALDLGMEKP